MGVTVNYNSYMDYVRDSNSRYINEYMVLSPTARKNLNSLMNNETFNANGSKNADDIWINHITSYTNKEILVDITGYLTIDKFNQLKERDELQEFLEANENEHEFNVLSLANRDLTILDFDLNKDEWIAFYY